MITIRAGVGVITQGDVPQEKTNEKETEMKSKPRRIYIEPEKRLDVVRKVLALTADPSVSLEDACKEVGVTEGSYYRYMRAARRAGVLVESKATKIDEYKKIVASVDERKLNTKEGDRAACKALGLSVYKLWYARRVLKSKVKTAREAPKGRVNGAIHINVSALDRETADSILASYIRAHGPEIAIKKISRGVA